MKVLTIFVSFMIILSCSADETSTNLTLSENLEKEFKEIENFLEINKENYESNILNLKELFAVLCKVLYDKLNMISDKRFDLAEKFNNSDGVLEKKLHESLLKNFYFKYEEVSTNDSICHKYLHFHEQLKLNIYCHSWLYNYAQPVFKLEKIFRIIAGKSENEEMKENSKELEALKSETEELLEYFEKFIRFQTKLLEIFLKVFEYENCIGKLPCGTFIPYDVENDFEAPKKFGVSAGKYFDGTEVYIGSGYIFDPVTKIKDAEIPGRISINSTSTFLHLDDYEDVLTNTTIFYLLKHENLKWIDFKKDSKNSSLLNAVSLKVWRDTRHIYRFNFFNYTTIGTNGLDEKIYFRIENKHFTIDNLEVLICDEKN